MKTIEEIKAKMMALEEHMAKIRERQSELKDNLQHGSYIDIDEYEQNEIQLEIVATEYLAYKWVIGDEE